MSAQPSPSESLQALADERSIPVHMVLELTHRCNQTCRHCYLTRPEEARSRKELSAQEWRAVLEDMAEAGTLFLTFTGGEPLLREDLAALLCRARELAFGVTVFTNATLITPETAALWAELSVSAGISVYGAGAATHDKITGMTGSFDRTMAGAGLLRKAGVPVRLKTPLMRPNIKESRDIISLARDKGLTWQFDPMITRANDGTDISSKLGLDDEALARLFLDQDLSPRDGLLEAVPPGPHDSACSAGRTFGAIGPFGHVYPCLQWLAPAGNVRQIPFGTIWRASGLLVEARERAWQDLKPCPTCSQTHFSHCPGLAYLEHQDPLVPPENSCRLSRAVRAGKACAASETRT